LVFGNGKNWQGSAKLSPLSLLLPPSEFCNDEKNSVIRSAMDALRNSKKNSLLAVAILFLFTFFTLILDAPRTYVGTKAFLKGWNLGLNLLILVNFLDPGCGSACPHGFVSGRANSMPIHADPDPQHCP
jgi:hypothetical protein